MAQKSKCDNCRKEIEENDDVYKVTAVMKKDNIKITKNFCGLKCANAWNLTHKKEPPMKQTLEEEIMEAIVVEKDHVGEGQKIAEQHEKFEGIAIEKQYEESESSAGQEAYNQNKIQQPKYAAEPPKMDYIENQDFYIKREDFDAIKNTMHEIKAQELGMSSVNDSDLWEIEPETKKLKIRKMPRGTLDMLKQKGILVDYYKQL